jgi:hypothetical protein
MLLVLSSIYDQYANAGAALWRAKGAEVAVMTCHDLAQAGWRLTLDDEPTLVVGGKPVATKDVQGVVTRISGVTAAELPFMHFEDREYAASEMQAFLLALLTTLKCPVLNRPQPGCLNGPPWIAEQWVACAARAGVAVRPIVRRAYAGGYVVVEDQPADRRVVHVVGDDAFGDAPAAVRKAAIAVAKAAGVDLLRVALDVRAKAPVFLDADPWVDIADKSVAEAIRKKVAA